MTDGIPVKLPSEPKSLAANIGGELYVIPREIWKYVGILHGHVQSKYVDHSDHAPPIHDLVESLGFNLEPDDVEFLASHTGTFASGDGTVTLWSLVSRDALALMLKLTSDIADESGESVEVLKCNRSVLRNDLELGLLYASKFDGLIRGFGDDNEVDQLRRVTRVRNRLVKLVEQIPEKLSRIGDQIDLWGQAVSQEIGYCDEETMPELRELLGSFDKESPVWKNLAGNSELRTYRARVRRLVLLNCCAMVIFLATVVFQAVAFYEPNVPSPGLYSDVINLQRVGAYGEVFIGELPRAWAIADDRRRLELVSALWDRLVDAKYRAMFLVDSRNEPMVWWSRKQLHFMKTALAAGTPGPGQLPKPDESDSDGEIEDEEWDEDDEWSDGDIADADVDDYDNFDSGDEPADTEFN